MLLQAFAKSRETLALCTTDVVVLEGELRLLNQNRLLPLPCVMQLCSLSLSLSLSLFTIIATP